jgi:hypothetical protein
MDQRPESQDPQGIMGATAVENAVASVDQRRRKRTQKDNSTRVRTQEETASRSL